MSNKEKPKAFNITVSFDEALGRYVQTDVKEVLDVQKEDMQDGTIDDLIDAFEASAQKTDDGVEYWMARDIQMLLDYKEWRKFSENVILRAKDACQESNNIIEDHFVHVDKMVTLGSGAERSVGDIMLSRYACYLVAQNGDARKRPVAFAQTYFAIQTRKQEIAQQNKDTAVPMSEDEQRVYLRDQIKGHNKQLASAAKGAGVTTPQQFARFHTMGYKGLYKMSKREIQQHRGLAKSADILDRMGSTELAANFFRVTQTEEKLRNEGIQGANNANAAHFEVGQQVRAAMLKISGTTPEDLPIVDNISKARKRLKSVPMKGAINEEPKPAPMAVEKETQVIDDDDVMEVDLRKDLWKYALLVMVQRPNMEISTSDLIAELPKYIALPKGTEQTNSSRGDTKFSQIVRNLKSHKDSANNFMKLGYAEAIPRGFRATDKGLQFVVDFFNRQP